MAIAQIPPSSTLTSARRRAIVARSVELRDTPVELISKRLAKALLAPRLRPVAHIHRAPREQGGGRADDPEWRNPNRSSHCRSRVKIIMPRKTAMPATRSRAEDVDDPSLPAPLLLQLRLILPQRQMKQGLVHAMQRGRVLRPPDRHQIVEIHDSVSSARLPASADLIRLIFTPTLLSVMPTMAAISL